MGTVRVQAAVVATLVIGLVTPALAEPTDIDFNRDVRPILSESCFTCHGPDEEERKAGLRLDMRVGAVTDLGDGLAAVVPGEPEASALIDRVTAESDRHVMPPPDVGDRLSDEQVDTLRRWIEADAPYAEHWAYVPPERPELPQVEQADWPANPIDFFVLHRLEEHGLSPSPEANATTLARRVSLDMTGLPPTPEQVGRHLADTGPGAYERMVDRVLHRPAYGEHWARHWLDLARYADSSGYAEDVPREIWGYRDYVIRAFNENRPFDAFTIEQIAGDLLENPTQRQMVATAFHRNTPTNAEGGVDAEEFRNAAVVDRVNTTFEVWMGTTMSCAQCHTHKYDPITLEEYFQAFAFFNQTADNNRRDEVPVYRFYTKQQQHERERLNERIAELEQTLAEPGEPVRQAFAEWAADLREPLEWRAAEQVTVEDGPEETTAIAVPIKRAGELTAVRLDATDADATATLTQLRAALHTADADAVRGRYVRITLPGDGRILSLAEVEAFADAQNVAPAGEARQSSTDFNGPAEHAIDGNTDGDYTARSVTHTETESDPWWELDLHEPRRIDRIVIWNRTDGGQGIADRLAGFEIEVLDEQRQVVWRQQFESTPSPSTAFDTGGGSPVEFAVALAESYDRTTGPVVRGATAPDWAINDDASALTLLLRESVAVEAGETLRLSVDGLNGVDAADGLAVDLSDSASATELAKLPAEPLTLLRTAAAHLSDDDRERLLRFYAAQRAPALAAEREQLASLRTELDEMPQATVPIMQRVADDKLRTTRIQHRGNFMSTGAAVRPGVPAAFHDMPVDGEPDRLDLARWLVSEKNPLTARVTVNRLWQEVFGTGLVATSEDFGSQGERPSHPDLLDWLAVEFMESGWDVRHILRLMVTSAAYRQSSEVTSAHRRHDPDNRLISRGPRFRLAAETIRDQALFAAGLLSSKMYGPPVHPPRPATGVSAAFGSAIDWKTSEGEDRYRRGLYTRWRRSNPYPSMATFDAPSRQVCTVQRDRTNTPLQALVTMNDPVFVEAAQGLARRMVRAGDDQADRARAGFRIVLSREPAESELATVLELYRDTRARYADEPEMAHDMATDPLGPVGEDTDVTDVAAWTVVANVLLNLDETLMRR